MHPSGRRQIHVSCACGQSVPGFSVFQVFELCGTKFCLCLLVGTLVLVLETVYSGSVMASSSLHPPFTCGVSFHYKDGIMSFGVGSLVNFSSILD